jgi:hypothetical protein
MQQSYVMTSDDLEKYFVGFAQKLAHSSGALHLVELTATAQAMPESLLAGLTAKMAQLDPRVVGWVKRSAA